MVGETRLAGNSGRADLDGIKNRIRGAVLALACGNSLGSSAVGLTRKEILGSTGYACLRDFLPGLSKSQYPEHVAGKIGAAAFQSLTLGNSLAENNGRFIRDDVKNRFRLMLEDDKFLNTLPKAGCLAGLRQMVDGLESESINDELQIADIGVVVRGSMAGCLPGPTKTEEPAEIAKEQCLPTHSDSRVLAAAAVLADSIHFFIAGHRLDTEDEVRAFVKRELEIANNIDPRFADAWDGIAPDLDYSNPAEDLPYSVVNVQPDVSELLPTAVGIFLIFRHSLEEAISTAALAGGETDTTASIVGALSGAYHGAKAIPERWLEQLAHHSDFEDLSNKLYKLWI
jgi:ADP-ribosylglycohydrolase